MFFVIVVMTGSLFAQTDTSQAFSDTAVLKYPIQDRWQHKIVYPSYNKFSLDYSTVLKDSTYYDPVAKKYYYFEKIGDTIYKKSLFLSVVEYVQLFGKQLDRKYFYERNKTLDLINYQQARPKHRIYESMFNKLFGMPKIDVSSYKQKLKKIEIYPTGSIGLTAGYASQQTDNPSLSEQQRKSSHFDFKMNPDIGVEAQIGDRLKVPISYSTLSNGIANFQQSLQSQLKLDYEGHEDAIIRRLQAGTVSFNAVGRYMPSIQNLFGVKAELQLGKLYITTALANSQSQKASVEMAGGAYAQKIRISLGDYVENRHFLLADYFRKNYNKTMSSLPVVKTPVQILKAEVWVTNKNNVLDTARDVVAFMDLGEVQPYSTHIQKNDLFGQDLPSNDANHLYRVLTNTEVARAPSTVTSFLQTQGLVAGQDFEKVYARKLGAFDYTLNTQAGFISLHQSLQPDEVLAVAYQYMYNGKVYQVGEFANEVALDSTSGVQKVLFLKMLKSSSQRVDLPIWHWMMKNVYSLDVYDVLPNDFNLNIYYQEASAGTKRYLPETSPQVAGKSLLSILQMDRLNTRQDPVPDGQFDFVPNFTILPQQGQVIFSLLEPLGRDLEARAFEGMPKAIKDKYVYYALYDSVKLVANAQANLNKFFLQGTVKGDEKYGIRIAPNTPPGSVKIIAGSRVLQEGTDYSIDYTYGSVVIFNKELYERANTPIRVEYENAMTFGAYQRNFFGTRMEYRFDKNFYIGGTFTSLKETPYTNKINYGDDPIHNKMLGVDFSYKSELPYLTNLLNKTPFYKTAATSSIHMMGEAAFLFPGHNQQIGAGRKGAVYIDDFESASSHTDLTFPATAWVLASTPAGNGLFPEADLNNHLDYGKNRAKLAWYKIEPSLQQKSNNDNPLQKNLSELSDARVRAIYLSELFPQQSSNIAGLQTSSFDIAYYPQERGPYNYSSQINELDANGNLLYPKQRWGGIMRALDYTDFEANNIEYIEFWLQDPFIKSPNSNGGKLILNLGNVSEDILKDGKRFYENGIPTPNQPLETDNNTVWGKTPINPIQLTNSFSNSAEDRPLQDVGLDGLNDEEEIQKFAPYLMLLSSNFGTHSVAYQKALADPSGDNYKWYRDADFAQKGILERYKNYNNTQGNSPVSTAEIYSSAATIYPDNEDINKDNTLNQIEQYFEYTVDLKPRMSLNDTYIADVRTIQPNLANDSLAHETWYLVRIPVKNFTNRVGKIADFKSIKFLRLYLTGFEEPVVLRLLKFGMVRNQWRTFPYELDTTASYKPIPTQNLTSLLLSSINIEENSNRQPIPYKIPPGISRMQSLAENGVNLFQNEQALSLKVIRLKSKENRSIYRTTRFDMRQYGQLSMFIHAESVVGEKSIQNGDLHAVVRLGQDFLNNYYEIRIPLKVTQPSSTALDEEIWPYENNLDIALQDLVNLKLERNALQYASEKIFRKNVGNRVLSVRGNPNLGEVQGVLIGLENASDYDQLSAEVWVNELRLSKINESGGAAAQGRTDIQLADLGSISISANAYTAGFGSIEQNVNQRMKHDMLQFDASANVNLGKLLPHKVAGGNIPIVASVNKTIAMPQYDPYDQDVFFSDKLKKETDKRKKDSIRNIAQEQTLTKTISIASVRFGTPQEHKKLWDINNFDFAYSYSSVQHSSPLVKENTTIKNYFNIGYSFATIPKYIEPFKRSIRNKNEWLIFLRDFNINPYPNQISIRASIDRQYSSFSPRTVQLWEGGSIVDDLETTYDKYFKLNRDYNIIWNITKSMAASFIANNFSYVDEPYGEINTAAKRDSLWNNFWSGGRNVQYQQKAVLSYTPPLHKIPALKFVNRLQLEYASSYEWMGASLLAISLGNIIQNSQSTRVNAGIDFEKIYEKSAYIRQANKSREARKKENELYLASLKDSTQQKLLPLPDYPKKSVFLEGLTGKERRDSLRKWYSMRDAYQKAKKEYNKNKKIYLPEGFVMPLQLMTMVKSIHFDYSAGYQSRLPGFTPHISYLGQNWSLKQPGIGYAFGQQPTSQWLQAMASAGAITRNKDFNEMFRQSFVQEIKVSASLQPIKGLNIDMHARKSFAKEYSELFKDTLGNGNFKHLSPFANGSFEVSYIALNTFFKKGLPTQVSPLFQTFSDNRLIVAKRLAHQNPYYDNTHTNDGYPVGYGRYAQNVLIPAFLASYLNQDPTTIDLVQEHNSLMQTNPLSGILPLPNWNISYNGLSDALKLNKYIGSINLMHAYSASLKMNSFSSSLFFQDPYGYQVPAFKDPISGNFVPYFLIPNLTIEESFSPLLGVDISLKNQSAFRFTYEKNRIVSLSLTNYQVSETNATNISASAQWQKKVFWSFLPNFKSFKLSLAKKEATHSNPFDEDAPTTEGSTDGGTDINMGITFALRDQQMSNTILDQKNGYNTGGFKEIMLNPTVGMTLSKRVNITFYYNFIRRIPYVSSSTVTPSTNISAGIDIKIMLQ